MPLLKLRKTKIMDNRTNIDGSTEQLCGDTSNVAVESDLGTSSITFINDNTQPVNEEAYSNGFNFENKVIRSNFCLKLFLIISAQFAITSGITSWFLFDNSVTNFNRKNVSLLIIIAVVSIMNFIMLGFCGELRRQFPVNYAFLMTVTICKAFLLATIASYYDNFIIVITVSLISMTLLLLSISAAQTFVKFNYFVGLILCFCFILICDCLIHFFSSLSILDTLYSSLSALIIAVYFLHEVLSMVQGNHTFNIAPYECIFAALCTYLDVPNVIFGVCFICIGNVKE
ncbi:protein lifeguard 1-like [Diorhabda carinulata]|uniref:protein lifeguard 1-like n=1 Tax=Diorhabda carinulata TaxID=1163345 RepID=UPI00259FE41C|nr:protein lifeguard 1-like [Diorhabda carinulata]